MRYFDRRHVESCLDIPLCLELSQKAFELHSQGLVQQPDRTIIASGDGRLMGTMPAYISRGDYAGFGLKAILADFSVSEPHEGCILLYDTQGMVAVDASSVTELRTAAASAWATDLLAPEGASQLAILGTGIQARKHLQMMKAIRPVESVTIWGWREAGVRRFADWAQTETGIEIRVADTPAEAVAEADIICTVTASREPLLSASDLPEKCHINAVGASAMGFQELDADVYRDCDYFLDSRLASAAASQCLQQAKEQGYISPDDQGREIGELSPVHPVELTSQRTLFKSIGLAVQDLVFAREILRLSA
ncbi:ornithine cyclodeaminase family protein [Vibrio quintilis]|uniref:L-lysine cyclodeaminase n=1 Tax=Vibrio quintilis TaxID=1117707 RepID=A0A1M7Z1W2_9VIBR|nr:ornithine cyclodeaminase family protein [Vibrio quintilis]SHO58666.1 L-lysine cyclodeaminase [Vibrio quintilis]